jgi:hypothetical protein
MSYYFTILSPTDVPLFNIAFGTSKSGGDGIARFRFPDAAQNTYMTQFIINSSLDMLEEAQWMSGNMYVPCPVFSWVYLLLGILGLLSRANIGGGQQVLKTHRHLPPSLSIHIRLSNPVRNALRPPAPTPATEHPRLLNNLRRSR